MLNELLTPKSGVWLILLRLSPLLATSVLYLCVGALTTRPHKLLHQMLVMVPLLLALAQVNHPLLRNLLALAPVLLIAADMSLSLFSWLEYRGRFSYGFALSALETQRREAVGMLTVYRRYVLFFIAVAAIMFAAINLAPRLPARLNALPLIIMSAALGIYTLQAVAHQWRKNNISDPLQRVVSNLPVSNLNPFLQALRDKRMIASVSRRVPVYDLTRHDTGIDTYVVVIGESARPANMHLYGYSRPTTPAAGRERPNMLLFTHAISGAPVTATAVPLALSAATVTDMNVRHYADNVINIANQAGFETHWYSNQGMYGDYSNAITGIAMNAHFRQWVNGRYDDALLAPLDLALQRPGKKLIVLHLYGSHPPAGERYPEEERYFPDPGDPDDSYDNAIRFTDTLLGQIFSRLRQKRASLLYFSDHGLERVSGKKNGWRHGGAKPTQAAFQVPMFLWRSPQVTSGWLPEGTVSAPYSTVDNNALISQWMGITLRHRPPLTFTQLLERRNTEVCVVDTTGEVYRWAELRAEAPPPPGITTAAESTP